MNISCAQNVDPVSLHCFNRVYPSCFSKGADRLVREIFIGTDVLKQPRVKFVRGHAKTFQAIILPNIEHDTSVVAVLRKTQRKPSVTASTEKEYALYHILWRQPIPQ